MRSRIQTITPKQAKKYLSGQTSNRHLSKRAVEMMAEDMKAGRWVSNGESIKLDTKGKLLDGQHRLSACIKANKPFKTLVVSGLPPHAIETVDQGTRRSPAHILQMLKPPARNANNMAAALRMLWQFEKFGQVHYGSKLAAYPTRAQVLDLYHRSPGINESVKWGMILHKYTGILSCAQIATLHWLFKEKAGLTRADAFFTEMREGAQPKSPIAVLLKRLNSSGKSRREAGVAMTIKAWNAWLTGEKLLVVKYSSRESFPDILSGKEK